MHRLDGLRAQKLVRGGGYERRRRGGQSDEDRSKCCRERYRGREQREERCVEEVGENGECLSVG